MFTTMLESVSLPILQLYKLSLGGASQGGQGLYKY